MQTGSCSASAAEFTVRESLLARIGKVVLPVAGEFLYLNWMLTARRRHECLVLCYHGVVPDEIAEDPQRYGNLVSVSEFSEQMSLLARTMTPIDLAALDGWLHGRSALPPNPVLVTLDDGYRNNIVYAAGILAKFGIPAVFFPVVGHIGTDRLLWPTEIYRSILLWPSPQVMLPDGSTITIPPNDLEKRAALAKWVREFSKTLSEEQKDLYLSHLREADFPALTPDELEMFVFLSWAELGRLHQMGFTIGSHTMDHCILTGVQADHLQRGLEESKRQLEKQLETSCISLAYPNGSRADYSAQVIAGTARAGYKLAFTTNPGTCTRYTDPLTLNRICIPGKLSRLGYRSRISGLNDLLKSSLR